MVITLVLVTTLAGLAALLFSEAQRDRIEGIIKNELDELVKVAQAWEVGHHRQILISDVEESMRKHAVPLFPDRRTGTLVFFVDSGKLPDTPSDPWGSEYLIDPLQGFIFSIGADKMPRTADDLSRAYRKEGASGTSMFEKDLRACKVPPIIASFEPCETTIKISKPTIRATYYASAGCTVDLAKTELFLDQYPVQGVSKSSGQIVYQPSTPLTDGTHNAVLVVKDTAGNETRRQCSFLVNTNPAIVLLTKPPSGTALFGDVKIEGAVIDKSLRNWTLNWDFREIARGESEVGTQDASTRIYPATLLERFDTANSTNPIGDGRHFITLFARDLAGQVVTAQSEVTVDNTPPSAAITRNHPGASGTPQVITTDIPRFFGVAQDNLMVRTVLFKYIDVNTGQPAVGQPLNGTTAVPTRWDPLDISTVKNWGALYNSPSVEWGTVPSKGTTRSQNDAGFVPVRLLPGEYRLEVTAMDLAGNKSAVKTTEFNVNLFQGGITGNIFLDKTAQARQPPFFEEDKHITSLEALVPKEQSRGVVRFRALEAGRTSIATWEVVIDDNGGTDLRSADGQYVTTGPSRDWVATGKLPTTTSELIVTGDYVPNGANPYESVSNFDRRNSGVRTGKISEGVYSARIRYTNDAGVSKTSVTTFFIDNTPPVLPPTGVVDEKIIQYLYNPDPKSPSVQSWRTLAKDVFSGKEAVIEYFSVPGIDLGAGQLQFKGQTRDYPTTGVISSVTWELGIKPSSAGSYTAIVNGPVYTLTSSVKRSNVVTYGFSTAGVPTMTIATSTPGGLDGNGYMITVKAVDGAGLTTSVMRPFMINTVGPLITNFKVENSKGGQPVLIVPTIGDLPTVHAVDGQNLKISFTAVDETEISDIRYNLFAQTANSGAGLPTHVKPVSGLLTSEPRSLTIANTDDQKTFQSLPTTYQLQLVASNASRDGPIFRTAVAFRFLANLAIYAPYYVADSTKTSLYATLASTNVSWVGMDEQIAVANFLYDNVQTAGYRKIFDFTGVVRRSTVEGDRDDVATWISAATSNQTTDVLVVLDGMPNSLWTNRVDDLLVRYVESRSTDSAKTTNKDGDCLVWMGEMPLSWIFTETGVRQKVLGANSKSDGPSTFYRLGTSPNLYALSPSSGVPVAGNTAEIQELAPLGACAAYIPDMYPYDPFSDFSSLTGSGKTFARQLKNVSMAPGTLRGAAETWLLDRLFSVDQDKLALIKTAGQPVSGGNFQFRNVNSRGIVAHFMCAGPSDGTGVDDYPNVVAGLRKAIPDAGPIIRDYIDNYLLNQADPSLASRRVYFNGPADPRLGGLSLGSTARDVVYWPTRSEGYGNVTTISNSSMDSVLQGVSANQAALFVSPDQTKTNGEYKYGDYSLFLYPPGSITISQPVHAAPIFQASIAANGTASAFVTKANLTVDSSGKTAMDNVAVFYTRAGAATSAITTGVGSLAGPAYHPRVSAGGSFVVFDSYNIYNTGTVPPNFSSLKRTSYPRIYRYSADKTAVYFDGEVSGERLDLPPSDIKTESSLPCVSKDGRMVCWQARNAYLPGASSRNAASQIVISFNRAPGSADPWVVGAITGDPAGDSTNPDMSSESVDGSNFPYVVFESVVQYDNACPTQSGCVEIVPSLLSVADGAVANGTPKTESKKSIYLFSGDFTRKLQRIATGDDADCLNPRISPDGEEVTFESRARKITGFLYSDGIRIVPQVVNNGTTGPNRVFRVRIRPLLTGTTPASAIIQRISPIDMDLSPNPALPAVPQLSN